MKFVFHNQAFSCALLQAMDCTAFGGADVEECLRTAERIREDDLESWHAEWMCTADAVRRQAGQYLAEGRAPVARDTFLRAATYYRTAETFLGLNPGDPRLETTRQSGAVCFVMAARLHASDELTARAKGPAVSDACACNGFFFSAGGHSSGGSGESPRPVVAIWGDADTALMDLYFAASAPAVRRGYHAAQAGERNPTPECLRQGLDGMLANRPNADPRRIALVRVSAPSEPCRADGGKLAARLPVRHLRAEVVFVGDANGARDALNNLAVAAARRTPRNDETVFEADHSCTGALARMHHEIFQSIDSYLIEN